MQGPDRCDNLAWRARRSLHGCYAQIASMRREACSLSGETLPAVAGKRLFTRVCHLSINSYLLT